ncbi:transposable element Tc1 transposase [Trichonephila clavipes]|nr:transposable element Tc1 transposase [Trichonephila clavipes]
MGVKNIKFLPEKTKIEQSTLLSVDLWSGREKKKRETGLARKRAENREGSLGFPGFVKPCLPKTQPFLKVQMPLEKVYHNHHSWHYRVRLRESVQPIRRLHKTCENVYPRTIRVSFDRLDTSIPTESSWNDEVEKLAYQLNEEAERTERPIRRLSKVMYGSTCADMQVDVMGEYLSCIKHVVGARINRWQTAGEIARHTTQATGRPISRFTVARRLHGGGLFARRPVLCVLLTLVHRGRRSLWCREHRNWRDNEWGSVLFTDERRFSLSSDSHRILIRRERGSRNHPSNIIKRDRGAIGLQFLFMDDNAPCHRTVAAEQLLERVRILNVWIGRYVSGSQSHRACMGFSRQTLGSSYLTFSNYSGASIGTARRMGSNASTIH